MIDFSEISLPFGVGELLQNSVELMGVFGPFILLGIVIIFTPFLWEFARVVVYAEKSAKVHKRARNAKFGEHFATEIIHHYKWKYSKKYRDGY